MASREMTFQEEALIYAQEAEQFFKQFNTNIFTLNDIKSIIERGLRIIQKAEKESSSKGKVLYICDRRACNQCNPECMHTNDISHAKDFELLHDVFVEQ
ncbi:MAG: hypothetical protein RSB62_11005 [Bacteroides sp.]